MKKNDCSPFCWRSACSRCSSRSRQARFALIGRIRLRIASAEEESAIIKP